MSAEAESPPVEVTLDEIVSLCKRRGFVFPASEIYGGLASTYDFGHYGVLLKQNVKDEWWRAMLDGPERIVALDSAIIEHPRVWEASGHLAGFTDPLVDCRTCKLRFRADKLEDAACGRKPSRHPGETPDCDLPEPRQFNLMLSTRLGAVEETSSLAYLRPETAQGIFVNFKNVAQLARRKPPFGIAQIGKSFRNEITPGNFLFRTREFEQMEMEYFVAPAEADDWYRYWIDERFRWYTRYGLRESHLRIRPHEADELSHYSRATTLYEETRRRHSVEYDDNGAIGRRYRRQDEIGTPWAFTIDEQTLDDDTVTVRDRDSLAQERLAIGGVRDWLGGGPEREWKTP